MNAIQPTTMQRLLAYSELELPLVFKRIERLFLVRKDFEGELVRIPLSDATLSHVHTLLRKSYQKPLELQTAVPWSIGIDRDRPAKALTQLWLYGTPFYELLTERQRIEVSWLEIARDVSSLIKLKEYTSSLYIGYLNQYKRSLPPAIQDYLLVHAKDEIVHALTLKQYMRLAGLPDYGNFPAYGHIAALFPEMHPCIGILGNLLMGWIIDAGAMYSTQTSDIDGITRELFKLHHVDKSRHFDFSRRVVEDYFSGTSRQERQRVRQIFRWVIPDMLATYRFEPEIARHTSFEFPISAAKPEFVNAIRQSAHNSLMDDLRFTELMNWLWTMDLI